MAEMHITASPAWDAWSELWTRFPPDVDLNALARSTRAIQRCRGDGVVDGETLLRLCLARGPGGKSLQETAVWAHLNGVAELVGQSLNERLHRSVGFLAALTHQLLMAQQPGPPLLWPDRCLRVADGSSLSQPGSKGTDWRLHGVYDLGRGGFSQLEITDRKGAESLLRREPVAGEVLIADRGYARAPEMQACLDRSGIGARDFIIRVGWKALALHQPDGTAFDLLAHLQQIPIDAGPQEWSVQARVGPRRRSSLLPIRLIALRLPEDKAAANRHKLKRKASRHQDKSDPRSVVAAGFVILATSLPQDIPAGEICTAYRLRWQIELAFKRLKSLVHIDRLPTRTAAGSLSWLHAHLIFALLTEDICQDFLESSPCGPCQRRSHVAVAGTEADTQRTVQHVVRGRSSRRPAR
jgi:hypothetical protein